MLSFQHLQSLILGIQLVELLGLLFLHLVVLLDELEVLLTKARVDLVLLLLHVCAQSLLILAPIFHLVLPD